MLSFALLEIYAAYYYYGNMMAIVRIDDDFKVAGKLLLNVIIS